MNLLVESSGLVSGAESLGLSAGGRRSLGRKRACVRDERRNKRPRREASGSEPGAAPAPWIVGPEATAEPLDLTRRRVA